MSDMSVEIINNGKLTDEELEAFNEWMATDTVLIGSGGRKITATFDDHDLAKTIYNNHFMLEPQDPWTIYVESWAEMPYNKTGRLVIHYGGRVYDGDAGFFIRETRYEGDQPLWSYIIRGIENNMV